MMRACGADDVEVCLLRQMFRKLRFLMIDDITVSDAEQPHLEERFRDWNYFAEN